MSIPTIVDYRKFALAQMAAEALYDFIATAPGMNLRPGAPFAGDIQARFLTDGNLHASKFTSTEAQAFASQWTVVEHISNTETGFSGTLFKALRDDATQNIRAGDLVLSFRSIEFVDDSARDSIATGSLEIKDTGWALGQISDMEQWYRSLNSRHLIDAPFSVTG